MTDTSIYHETFGILPDAIEILHDECVSVQLLRTLVPGGEITLERGNFWFNVFDGGPEVIRDGTDSFRLTMSMKGVESRALLIGTRESAMKLYGEWVLEAISPTHAFKLKFDYEIEDEAIARG